MAACYSCEADLPHGTPLCPACGAEQTDAARDQHLLASAYQGRLRRWQVGGALAAVVAFSLGLALGSGRATPSEAPSGASGVVAGPLGVEQANDIFLRSVNATFREKGADLGFVSWLPAPGGGIILEMTPPTEARPLTVWQALTAEQRTSLLGFLGVAYTRTLLKAGVKVDLTAGHPVVVLTYRGVDAPLAMRLKDGRLAVFPSPFDRAGPAIGTGSAPAAPAAPAAP